MRAGLVTILSRLLRTLLPHPHNKDLGGRPAWPPKREGGRLEAMQGRGLPDPPGLGLAVPFPEGPLTVPHGKTRPAGTLPTSRRSTLRPSLSQQGTDVDHNPNQHAHAPSQAPVSPSKLANTAMLTCPVPPEAGRLVAPSPQCPTAPPLLLLPQPSAHHLTYGLDGLRAPPRRRQGSNCSPLGFQGPPGKNLPRQRSNPTTTRMRDPTVHEVAWGLGGRGNATRSTMGQGVTGHPRGNATVLKYSLERTRRGGPPGLSQ